MLHREYFRKYESCQISWKSCLYSTHDTKAMAVFSVNKSKDTGRCEGYHGTLTGSLEKWVLCWEAEKDTGQWPWEDLIDIVCFFPLIFFFPYSTFFF